MKTLSLIVFASVFLALNGLPRTRLESLERKLHDAPADEDTMTLRSFPKTTFNELQLRRYCRGYKEHFARFCDGGHPTKKESSDKIVDFCHDYNKYCPGTAEEDSGSFLATPPPLPDDTGSSESLVLPPKLPGNSLNPLMDSPMLFDQPMADSTEHKPRGKLALTPQIVKSCTADCTLPHCTTECKCAHTYPVAHAMCNPPPTGDLVPICNKFYARCPMFQPVSY